jgi:SAM-dependent methyltransferase
MLEIRRQVVNSVSDSKTAYEEVYGSRGIRLSDSFYLWLLSLLGIAEGQTILDVSCGEGMLLQFAHCRGARSYGIELSEVAARVARENAGRAHIVVADAERLPWPDGQFDYVTNIGSLEHYLHPELSMREMARVLKDDGHACILVPNSFGLWGNIKHVWETGDIFDDGYQPIQRYCTRNGWTKLLKENGLTPYQVLKHERERPRTPKDALSFLRHPLRLLRLALLPLVPLNLSDRFVFLCHPERREMTRGN